MARPKLQLDENQILNYAKLGASNCEIASMMGCDEGTIRGRFSELVTKGRNVQKNRLRRWQWKAAKSGNVTMQIWLGKNHLGQSDKTVIEHSGPDGGPIETLQSFNFDQYRDLFAERQRKIIDGPAGENGNGAAAANGNGKSVHP